MPRKSKTKYQSIAAFLLDSELMLNNTLSNPDISARMAAAGYPAGDINARLSDLEALRSLNEQQALAYGEQYQATEAWKAAKAVLHKSYMTHLGLARIALKDNATAHAALVLGGDRAQSQSGYIGQVLGFYDNALAIPECAAALGGRGVAEAELAGGRASVLALQGLMSAQDKATGAARQATRERDAAYAALQQWMADYRSTARIVLRAVPQLMETLGIVEKG